MSLLASASSASWTMIQTYITKKAKLNHTVKFPKCTPPLQAKPSLHSCPSNVQTLHVCTDETSPKQILFLGRVSVYGGINYYYRVRILFWTKTLRTFQGHISHFFNDSVQCQKRVLSRCLFKFFHNMSIFIPKVFLCLLLFLCSST